MTISQLRINPSRLLENLAELAKIGALESGGISRLAFGEEDRRGREWFLLKLREIGLQVSVDCAGNISGLLPGTEPELPRVVTGSHLDTVPNGGPLDGALGVVAGMEALQTLFESEFRPRRSIELINFSDEEGRFGGLFGSQALAGMLDLQKLRRTPDLTGVSLIEALEECGLNLEKAPRARRDPATLHAFVELHIEQGPVLEQEELEIGIVHGVAGLFKWNVRFYGMAAHSGTTPMPMRRDALLGAVDFLQLSESVLREHGSPHSVCNAGRIEAFPGAANVVPARVDLTFEVRDTDQDVLHRLSEAFRNNVSELAHQRGLTSEIEVLSEVAPKSCSESVVSVVEGAARDLKYRHRRMHSGAIHDALIVGEITDSAMLFVPSRNGRSHCPEEYTSPEQIEAGANVLLRSLWRLAL